MSGNLESDGWRLETAFRAGFSPTDYRTVKLAPPRRVSGQTDETNPVGNQRHITCPKDWGTTNVLQATLDRLLPPQGIAQRLRNKVG